MSSPRVHFLLCTAAVAILALYAISLIAVASYYHDGNHITYYETLNWSAIFSNLTYLTVHDFAAALAGGSVIPSVTACGASLFPFLWAGTFLLLVLPTKVGPRLLALLLGVQAAVFLLVGGLWGLLTLPFTLVDGRNLDGEWLGEHWPLFHTFALWGLFCLAASVLSLTSKRAA